MLTLTHQKMKPVQIIRLGLLVLIITIIGEVTRPEYKPRADQAETPIYLGTGAQQELF